MRRRSMPNTPHHNADSLGSPVDVAGNITCALNDLLVAAPARTDRHVSRPCIVGQERHAPEEVNDHVRDAAFALAACSPSPRPPTT
jgi:hypothetical protein